MISRELFKKPNNRLEGEKDMPEKDVGVCPECKAPLSGSVDRVCPRCGALLPMSARERVLWLTDKNSFREMDADVEAVDRLRFPGYEQKLAKMKLSTGEPEGVVTGTATIDGNPCAIFSMNPGFIMGSMGAAVGEKITRLFELATMKRLPVIGYAVSGGARIQEGMFSLMQMAKTSGAVLRHAEAGMLYAVVLTNPTTGGVVASFAMEADVIISEPGALIGFAGPRVIEQTMRQKLPEGFQRAEFLMQKGFIDRIVPRNAQKKELSLLLAMHGEGEAR